MQTIRRFLALPAACLVLAACQGTEPSGLARNQIHGVTAGIAAPNGQADVEEFEVCKFGSSADFSFTIDKRANGAGVDSSGTFTLTDGECKVLIVIGTVGADVSVTETGAQSGFHFDSVVVTTVTSVGSDCGTVTSSSSTQTSTTVTGIASGISTDGLCHGTLAEYYNSADEQLVGGRMTGGGAQITVGDVKITKGLTIHCDIVLSNNLEINWADNKWHLDKPLTSARCIDDPNIEPAPPPAPFDTFIGEGIGQLNGVDGSLVKFTFIDSGEPGGKNDMAAIQIFDAGGNLVLDVPLDFTDSGNLQAHYDQPHK